MNGNGDKKRKTPSFQDEPIAAIGIGCKFPDGIKGPEEFWHLLSTGRSVISEIPGIRQIIIQEKNHELPVQKGGFFNHIDLFDPEFFGISDEGAKLIDPQHRLLLEVTQETTEHAGYPITEFQKNKTGVFVSSTSHEYQNLLIKRHEASNSDVFQGSGNVAAERLTHTFGFHGPSIVIDTSCSSSLVAVHYAANSLRLRECKYAIAGGANLILSSDPELLSQSDHLSPDGICSTFDEHAKGFSLGEGCGMVILKRLEDAIHDGNTVYGVIRSSVVTNVGSGKFESSSSQNQEELLLETLERANIHAKDVGYIEANGTGNPDEDKAELTALNNVYGKKHTVENPLHVGSVKTNIGHLGPAAGIAGFIKALLSLYYGEIPSHLNCKEPIKSINWDKSFLQINTSHTVWAQEKKKRIAGISSLGICGTNIHLLLEESDIRKKENKRERNKQLLLLSARNESALRELSENFCNFLTELPDEHTADICYTSQTGRYHYEERLAITGSTNAELFAGIKSYLHGVSSKDDLFGKVKKNKKTKVCLLFPGIGSQYHGMGKELYEHEPIFRSALDECNELLQPYLQLPLLDVLYGNDKKDLINRIDYALPAIFSFEYALFRLWTSWGLKLGLLLGYGIGEYVAATVAGVFSLKDGLRLTAEIGAYMNRFKIGISSHIFSKEESLSSYFQKTFSSITVHSAQTPIISTFTGYIAKKEDFTDHEYWLKCLTSPTSFHKAVHIAQKSGSTVFLEGGGAPCFEDEIRESLTDRWEGTWLSSLQGDSNCIYDMTETLGALFVQGIEINWQAYSEKFNAEKISLPTYPFQRKRCWAENLYCNYSPTEKEKSGTAKKSKFNTKHLFYQTKWKPTPRPTTKAQKTNEGVTLILKDVKGKGQKIANLLRKAGHDVITLWQGKGFQKTGKNEYEIGDNAEDIQALFQEFPTKDISRIIHLQTILNRTEVRRTKDIQRLLELGLFSLFRLAHELSTRDNNANHIEFILISEYVNEITGTEFKLVPENAPFFGLGKVVTAENQNISCRCIDIDHFTHPETLFQEIETVNPPYLVAYRDETRYTEELCCFHTPVLSKRSLQLKKDGVYIITGGAGEIGLEIAKLLASRNAGNIVLVNRSLFPTQEHWKGIINEGSKLCRRVLTLQKIISYGANISFYSADISDKDSLEEILIELRGEFGSIHGVFHCAGVGQTKTIDKAKLQNFEKMLLPKVYGTWLLDTLTRQDHLDFFVLFSSASTFFQQTAHGSYIAANSYLDAYPNFAKKHGRRIQTINWAPWKETESYSEFHDHGIFKPLLTEEALTAFRKAMESGEERIIVGEIDFKKDINLCKCPLEYKLQQVFDEKP